MRIMYYVAGTASDCLPVVSKHVLVVVLVLAHRSMGICEQTDVLVYAHPQNSPIDDRVVRPKAIPSGENARSLLGNGSISISGHNITGLYKPTRPLTSSMERSAMQASSNTRPCLGPKLMSHRRSRRSMK